MRAYTVNKAGGDARPLRLSSTATINNHLHGAEALIQVAYRRCTEPADKQQVAVIPVYEKLCYKLFQCLNMLCELRGAQDVVHLRDELRIEFNR